MKASIICLQDTGHKRIHRILVILAVIVFPFLYLTKQAILDPEIEFLVPSLTSEWVLHPRQEILGSNYGRVSRDVQFARDFGVGNLPLRLELRIYAFREMTVSLNDHEVAPIHLAPHWKSPAIFDLAPYLQKGANHLQVFVHNSASVPALLVESPDWLRTPEAWQASLGPEFTELVPVVSADCPGPPVPLDNAVGPRQGPLQEWEGWVWARWLVGLWLSGLAILAVWILVRHFGPEESLPLREDRIYRRWVRVGVPLLVLSASIWLNVTNTGTYPYNKTYFDPAQHLDYIRHVSRNWTLALPTDGWEMYQPPLYYWFAAVIYALSGGDDHPDSAVKSAQFVGCISSIGLSVLSWLFARRLFPAHPSAQWMALIFASFLPMSLYMTPLLTNEVFSAMMIAASLYACVSCSEDGDITTRRALVLGLLTGLALLSKFTALFVFLAASVMLAWRTLRSTSRRAWMSLALFLGMALLVSGWFYARNLIFFGDPFIGNWDEESGFHYEQNPGYRTAEFYFRFGSVFFTHPEIAPWISWLDGNYASMWADVYRNFFDRDSVHSYFWISVTLILAAFPSLVIGLGLICTLISVLRKPDPDANLLMTLASFWTWFSLISFSMEVPTASTVKAFFFLSLLPILGVYFIRGRALLQLHVGLLRWLLDAVILVLGVLFFLLYRYSG